MADFNLYAVYLNGQIHYYTAFDIACLIDLGVLGVLDSYYCFESAKWQEIEKAPQIMKGVDPKFTQKREKKLLHKLPGSVPSPTEKDIPSLAPKFSKLKHKINTMQQRELQYKKYINKILKEKESAPPAGMFGWEDLVGEIFEVDDTPMWYMKESGTNTGPYAFSYVYELYKNEEINAKTLIKKEGDRVFNRISEVYEFNTRVFSKIDNSSGAGKARFFVRRTDFRIPFYEVVEVSFGDHRWKGHCTNLSIGGCFVEFGSFPKEITMNAVVNFKLKSKLLNETIEAQAIVKNIQNERSPGIGCAFLDLSSEHKAIISEYVEEFLGGEGRLKAS